MQNQGFSLIEVLVAMFILAMGLLGIAVLQINALRANYYAYLHSVAVVQAVNMLNRLQANYFAPNAELQTWNIRNHALLPQGKGEYQCTGYLNCKVTLHWYDGQTQVLTRSMASSTS